MRNLLIIFSLLLTSCASLPPPIVAVDSSLNSNNSMKIKVYRAKNDWLAAAIDFRVIVNGDYSGSIKRGEGVERFVPAGEIVVEVQSFFLGKPDSGHVKAVLNGKVGDEYIFRFSQHLDDFSYLPMGKAYSVYTVTGHTELNMVRNESWASKK